MISYMMRNYLGSITGMSARFHANMSELLLSFWTKVDPYYLYLFQFFQQVGAYDHNFPLDLSIWIYILLNAPLDKYIHWMKKTLKMTKKKAKTHWRTTQRAPVVQTSAKNHCFCTYARGTCAYEKKQLFVVFFQWVWGKSPVFQPKPT